MQPKDLCLTLVFLLGCSLAMDNDVCSYKSFPIFAGGDKAETVNCLAVDHETGLMYTGGKSTSSNFAPAENDHGFIYALD